MKNNKEFNNLNLKFKTIKEEFLIQKVELEMLMK